MELRKPNMVTESKELGTLLLDIGTSMMQSGASSTITKNVMVKFAEIYHFVPHITIGPNSVTVILNDEYHNTHFNSIRTISAEGVNFKVIAGISRLKSITAEKKLTIHELKEELNKSLASRHYPRIIILCFVSLAGAAFCYTFGGTSIEMLIAFGATFCGLFTKQQLVKNKLNPYIITYIAATVATLFTGIFHITGLVNSPVNAFATCVLFLIPGVLLINSFIDLIDGNILNGIVRGANALIHSLAIALGILTTIIVFNLKG